MKPSKTNSESTQSSQLAWLNNLRTVMVFLVVLIHAAGVYEASGIWGSFWIVDDPATNNYSGLIFIIMDIFIMPVLFLISGYLAPVSIANRSAGRFILSKARRLLLPWAIAVFTLIPLYKVIFLASRGLPQQPWTSYFHFSNGGWGMNWLWFLPALFAANLVYLAWTRIGIRIPKLTTPVVLMITFLACFGYSYAMDVLGLRGWTKLPVIDFQNERILIYLAAFFLGGWFRISGAWAGKPHLGWFYYTVSGTNWIPIMLYVVLLLYPWINPGQFIVSASFHKAALWLNFHLSLFSTAYLLVASFRRYLDREGAIMAIFNRNSYSIYLIHVIVQGGIAWGMLYLDAPSFAKHLILAITSYLASCLLVSCYRIVAGGIGYLTRNDGATGTSSIPDNFMEHGAGGQAG